MSKYRVLLVDDQQLLRQGLSMLLGTVSDLEVVGEAQHGREALALIPGTRPTVVLTDARMPVMDGVELVAACAEVHPGLPVIVLTTFDDHELVQRALGAGAAGFLLKDTSTDQVAEAIRAVVAGGMVIDPRVARLAMTTPPADAGPAALALLTATERLVAERLATGGTNAEIAADLSLAEGTVRNQVSALLRKLNQRDRTALALMLYQAFHAAS